MFRYYSLARVCYAYLHDVRFFNVFESGGRTAFLGSLWHTRGWTLQELIAPSVVIFLSNDWRVIGSKAELAVEIEQATQVPASLLRLEADLASFSVAQRMSWAARRETTRPEDHAYCMLGLFGIKLTPLYGEGLSDAFYRLQEEIMKRFADTTLFAWHGALPADLQANDASMFQSPSSHDHSLASYLLAPSPHAFLDSRGILFTPPIVGGPQYDGASHVSYVSVNHKSTPISYTSLIFLLANVSSKQPARSYEDSELRRVPTFSITPHGILAYIPLGHCDLGTISIFFWSSSNDSRMGLRLIPCPNSIDPSRPLYDIDSSEERIASLRRDERGQLLYRDSIITIEWKEIYLAHRPPPEKLPLEQTQSLYMPLNLGILTPFRIPGSQLGLLYYNTGLRLAEITAVQLPWDGYEPFMLTFRVPTEERPMRTSFPGITIHLGRCARSVPDGQLGPHWAKLMFHPFGSAGPRARPGSVTHSCSEDHINVWPEYTKLFTVALPGSGSNLFWVVSAPGPSLPSITLSFTKCSLNPEKTLVLNISVTER